MRLGQRSSNEFIKELNEITESIHLLFKDKITQMTQMIDTKVMLGDSTVITQKTFDPMIIKHYFEEIVKRLDGWEIQDISVSNNEDIRRLFTKFEIREGNYLLSGHMSIQFHVLLYYKPIHRVIECQRELAEIIDLTKNKEEQIARESEEYILRKLDELGYGELDNQKLFEVFFENDSLRDKIHQEIENKSDFNFKDQESKKHALFSELDGYLMETYQIVPVMIDDVRLISGEEGCLCTFDIEYIKNKTKEGLFDPRKISERTRNQIKNRLKHFEGILKSLS